MKKFAILALAAMVAVPASAAGVTISGYVDIGYIASEAFGGGNQLQASAATNGTNGQNDGFSLNEVNIDLASQLTNDISAFVSLDFNSRTPGGAVAGPGVDYAYVDIANPGPFDLNVRAGRIPSVVGIEQRMSESNQTSFVNLSLLSPLTVGSIDGAAIYGSFSPVNYALAVSNQDVVAGLTGARGTFNDAATAHVAGTLAGEYDVTGIVPTAGVVAAPFRVGAPRNNNGSALASGLNNNNDLSVSGRVGIVPVEGLEVGASLSHDKFFAGASGTGTTQLARAVAGVDVSYAYGPFGLKGEWVKATEDQRGFSAGGGNAPKMEVRGYYVEGSYDVSSKYSVGVRFNRIQTDAGNAPAASTMKNDWSTLAIAGVYRLADNVSLKAEYDINKEHELASGGIATGGPNTAAGGRTVDEVDNDAFVMSLVGSF